jgi:hypothetical protein
MHASNIRVLANEASALVRDPLQTKDMIINTIRLRGDRLNVPTMAVENIVRTALAQLEKNWNWHSVYSGVNAHLMGMVDEALAGSTEDLRWRSRAILALLESLRPEDES